MAGGAWSRVKSCDHVPHQAVSKEKKTSLMLAKHSGPVGGRLCVMLEVVEPYVFVCLSNVYRTHECRAQFSWVYCIAGELLICCILSLYRGRLLQGQLYREK